MSSSPLSPSTSPPSAAAPFLSVVIPAYNEEERIEATLVSVHNYLVPQPFAWEILVVLDGATDHTLERVQTFAAQMDNRANNVANSGQKEGRTNGGSRHRLRWIERRQNRGKGYTVREGMLAARGQIRLFTDADNSTDISHFDQMRPLLEEGCDVVICSRDRKDVAGARQAVPQSFFKRLLGNLGNLFIQLVAVPGIWDTQCGFKAFTQEAATSLFPLAQIAGWGFDIEILALAQQQNYRIGIIPADWINKAGTHVRTRDYFRTLGEALQVRWNLLTGVYRRSQNTGGLRPSDDVVEPKI